MSLKVAVIGLGVGMAHARAYARHPVAELVAVSDFNQEKLKDAQDEFGDSIKLYKDADDLLSDSSINLVSICSWDNFHHPQVLKAIEFNKHVFVEKPMCLSPQESLDIRNALNSAPDLKLSSNLILRTSPRFKGLKERIDSGSFGDIYYLEADYNYGRLSKLLAGWRGDLESYSVVYGGGVHMIDLLLWLSGNQEVVEVSAYGSKPLSKDSKFTNFDLVTSLIKFENGLIAKMCANFGCVYPHFHKLSVYGTQASFENQLDGACFVTERDVKHDDVDGMVQTAISGKETIDDPYPGYDSGSLAYQFVDSIVNNTEPEVSVDQLFRVMDICFAIEQAAHNGKAISLKSVESAA